MNLDLLTTLLCFLSISSLPTDACSHGCFYCDFDRTCRECIDGFYLTTNGSCLPCQYEGCTCSLETECFGCLDGYHRYGDVCCRDGCDCIELGQPCRWCPETHYLSAGQCFECPYEGCKCSTLRPCDECMEGYDRYGSICCRKNCTCSELGKPCTGCKPGFYAVSSSTGSDEVQCFPCIVGCSSCNDNRTCSTCLTGYYLSSGRCIQCHANCTSCTSGTSCSSCQLGYFQISNLCYRCFEGCTTCLSQSQSRCRSCLDGYYMSYISSYGRYGYCTACAASTCKTCTGSSGCASCHDGFFPSGSGCIRCPDNGRCASCLSYHQCSVCYEGFYLQTYDCLECPYGCRACNSSSLCTACRNGFFLLHGGCYRCRYECTSCLSMDDCTSCKDEFYLFNNTCRRCPPGCISCDTPSTCRSCETGYVLNGTSCQNPNDEDPYFLFNRTSYPACLDGQCSTCREGYYLMNSICWRCPFNCEACSFANNCTRCKPRHSLSSGNCISCPTGCAMCSSSSECYSCAEGYTLSGIGCSARQEMINQPVDSSTGNSVGVASLVIGLAIVVALGIGATFVFWRRRQQNQQPKLTEEAGHSREISNATYFKKELLKDDAQPISDSGTNNPAEMRESEIYDDVMRDSKCVNVCTGGRESEIYEVPE